MNYEEMTPKDFSVAVLKAYKPEIFEKDITIADVGDGGIAIFENGLVGAYAFLLTFNANRPDDVFPIIFENNIAISPNIVFEKEKIEGWEAWCDWFSFVDKSPIRAAMFVFLKMKDVEEEKNVRF